MVPFKIQYLQAGALSSDRFYQSLHKLPEINQQILENSIQQYLQRLQEQPKSLEKTDQTKLRDREAHGRGAQQGDQRPNKRETRSKVQENIVEKDDQGRITHLDVKI